MKEEEHGEEGPEMIAGERAAAVEQVEQKMFFYFPGGQIRGPAVFSLDLDFEIGPEICGDKDRKNIKDHGSDQGMVLSDEHSIAARNAILSMRWSVRREEWLFWGRNTHESCRPAAPERCLGLATPAAARTSDS